MFIRPLDEQKCPVDIQMSIGHIAVVLDMYEITTQRWLLKLIVSECESSWSG